ncbi:MAG: hypothetical protein AAFR46_20875 [Pseudomonadota bacterium]
MSLAGALALALAGCGDVSGSAFSASPELSAKAIELFQSVCLANVETPQAALAQVTPEPVAFGGGRYLVRASLDDEFSCRVNYAPADLLQEQRRAARSRRDVPAIQQRDPRRLVLTGVFFAGPGEVMLQLTATGYEAE